MVTMPEDTNGTFTPPYIAFKTLDGLVDRMKREEPPSRIDKSYLDNFSGGYQSQVLAALDSLHLLGPAGELSDRLKRLVAAEGDERKQIIDDMIREFYAPILALGANATQQQLIDGFSDLAPKVTGDTRRKAIAFFLNGCKYAGITVSRHWKVPRVPPSGKKPRERDRDTGHEDEDDEDPTPPAANMRRLTLATGGVVTLGLSVDLFSLRGDDREFVFKLIDQMADYEDQHSATATDGRVVGLAASPSGGVADED